MCATELRKSFEFELDKNVHRRLTIFGREEIKPAAYQKEIVKIVLLEAEITLGEDIVKIPCRTCLTYCARG